MTVTEYFGASYLNLELMSMDVSTGATAVGLEKSLTMDRSSPDRVVMLAVLSYAAESKLSKSILTVTALGLLFTSLMMRSPFSSCTELANRVGADYTV